MNDLSLARILKNRAARIKGCTVTQTVFDRGGSSLGFRLEADNGAIFNVLVSVYRDALQ